MTVATLPLKHAPLSLVERPATGRTVGADEPGQLQPAWPENLVRMLTWTKALVVKPNSTHEGAAADALPISEAVVASTSGALTSNDYILTVERLRSLIDDEDEEDRPSSEAFGQALSLLRGAAQVVGMRFPRALAATGPGRSVRLLWSGPHKELRVVVGGAVTNRSYMYWRNGSESGVDETMDGTRLAEYLDWLVQDA